MVYITNNSRHTSFGYCDISTRQTKYVEEVP